jgi:hypothetical protein
LNSSPIDNPKKMKNAIVLFALIVGFKNNDFGNYKFDNKFNVSPDESFTLSPIRPGQLKYTKEIYSGDDMPCLKPSGHYIPCLKPDGIFSMRIYKPESIVTGTSW